MSRWIPASLLILTFVLALVPRPVCGQDAELAKLKARVKVFFDNLTTGGVEPQKAFKDLLSPGPADASRDDEIQEIVARYRLLDKYGKFLAVESLDGRRVGEDVVVLKYLYKAENYPIVWLFTFYRRPATDWFVIGLRFDARIEALGM